MKRFLIAIAVLFACAAHGESQLVAKVSGWTIYKSTDGMTDETSCTALYDKHDNIGMLKDRIVLTMQGRGGISAYQYRFGKEPASPLTLQLANDGVNHWLSGDMDRVLGSSTLNLRIVTILGPVVSYEVDLRPAKAIHKILMSDKCKFAL